MKIEPADLLDAAASLFHAFTFERLIPLGMLFSMSCLFLWVLFLAQKRDDFDASMFLRNDRGMLDLKQLTTFLCFMGHTWYFFNETMAGKMTDTAVSIYVGAWGAIAVGLHALDTVRAIKTNQPLPDNPMPPATVHPPPIPPTATGEENVTLTLPKD